MAVQKHLATSALALVLVRDGKRSFARRGCNGLHVERVERLEEQSLQLVWTWSAGKDLATFQMDRSEALQSKCQ